MSSDMIRVTGINSGLDTESIISAYTSKQNKRVEDAKKGLQLNKWTQESWKSLNTKIYSFYSGTLSTNRLSSAYAKQKVETSSGALSVVAGDNAVNGVQTAKIKSTASAAYLTGSKIGVNKGSDSLCSTLNIDEGSQIKLVKKDGTETTIQIGGSSTDSNVKVVNTMDDLVGALKKAGVNANYDTANQRIFLSAKDTGKDYDFNLEGDNLALAKLGLASKEQINTLENPEKYKAANKIDGSNAVLLLNDAEFESNSNSFTINGSTYSINYMPSDPNESISITTKTDYDGVYEVIKNMLNEYNELVNEMSKLYNAESAKGYDPLTDEQREAMSEKEIEDWENKIKGALLKGDDTLNGVMDVLTNTVNASFKVNGKDMYLTDFGIATLGYFDAEENERYALHIDGNPEDGSTAGNADKLKSMIATDPSGTASFFSQLSNALYKNLYSKMGSSSLSSIYKVYNDKQLKTEQTDWEKKIKENEDKLSDMEDKYYAKFATMEKSLAKLNSSQASVSSFFAG